MGFDENELRLVFLFVAKLFMPYRAPASMQFFKRIPSSNLLFAYSSKK
ncbi:hypothetical protein C427_4454 [Paraglaciecola psychrophila 170]|uniref:Uncharacterized protein n=1 Tax=Paraglaciecola psychrophila 170 TaxID=1129794 RepID=K6Z242_9ALTE|nr:hypothetical protein C427_4454 [Paraglaciecola psychrophila 170]GAC39114.1 hypothetical protein GPSY_3503 [Paraglaciecola psychrophila 170]